jgi:hypothetical protein
MTVEWLADQYSNRMAHLGNATGRAPVVVASPTTACQPSGYVMTTHGEAGRKPKTSLIPVAETRGESPPLRQSPGVVRIVFGFGKVGASARKALVTVDGITSSSFPYFRNPYGLLLIN